LDKGKEAAEEQPAVPLARTPELVERLALMVECRGPGCQAQELPVAEEVYRASEFPVLGLVYLASAIRELEVARQVKWAAAPKAVIRRKVAVQRRAAIRHSAARCQGCSNRRLPMQ